MTRTARRINGQHRGPALAVPHFTGVDAADWTDLPPAAYPPNTIELIKYGLERKAAGELRILNGYVCDTCKGLTMTRDRHPGVTPKFVDHRAFDPGHRCPGTTVSLGYPEDAPPADWTPSHEWYRPSEDELIRLTDAAINHVLKGALLVRPLPLEEVRP